MTSELTNRILGDRYLLQQEIGGGGMGSVFRALDLQKNRQEVAIKVLYVPLMVGRGDSQADLRRRFAEEIRVSSLLGQHPHIIKVLDHGQEGEQAYLVMEYLKGQDLARWIQAKGALPIQQAIRLALQACDALEYAHTFQAKLGDREIHGVIHRDIKPSNLFIEQSLQGDKPTTRLKVLDFGVAKTLADQTLSLGTQKGGGFIGTARYASPEQIRGKSLDARSDIYSFGVVLYEMLTGSMPFRLETDSLHSWIHAHCYETPIEINPNTTSQAIPPALAEVVMDCLKKNPDERPQTMRELGSRLLQAYTLTVTQVSPSSTEILPSGSAAPSVQVNPTPPPSNKGKLPFRMTGSPAREFEDIRDQDLDLIEDEPVVAPPAEPGIPYYITERNLPPVDPPVVPETEALVSQAGDQPESKESTLVLRSSTVAQVPSSPPPPVPKVPAISSSPPTQLLRQTPGQTVLQSSDHGLKWLLAAGSLGIGALLAAFFLWPRPTVIDIADEAESTPTPVVTPSPTPTPEVTLAPTPEPEITLTPTPTPTPVPAPTPTPVLTSTPLAEYYQRLAQLANEAVTNGNCQPALDFMQRILQDYPDQQARLEEYRQQLVPRCTPTPTPAPTPTPTPTPVPKFTPLLPPTPPPPPMPTPAITPTPATPTPVAELALSGQWVYEGGSFAWQGSNCQVNAVSGVRETVSINHHGDQLSITSPGFRERSGQIRNNQFSVTGRAGGVGTPNITWSGTVSADGRSIRGTATCGGASFSITLTRQS